MTPLEIFAVIVLAGAVIILIYYYIREISKTGSGNIDTLKSSFGEARKGVSEAGSRVSNGITKNYNENTQKGSKMTGVSNRVSVFGESLKGKVKEVPISTDVFSGRIDEFLDERSDQLIKDWKLATKNDIGVLENRYNKVTKDIDNLEKRFTEFTANANKKFEEIEKRLDNLEIEEQI